MSFLKNLGQPKRQSLDQKALEFVKKVVPPNSDTGRPAPREHLQSLYDLTDKLIAEEKLDEIRAIANALINAPDLGHDIENFRQQFLERLEARLAYAPSIGNAKLLLEISVWSMPHWDGLNVKLGNRRLARIARDLACGQTPEVLSKCFLENKKLSNALLWFLLAHEITIRKLSVSIPSDLALPSKRYYGSTTIMDDWNLYRCHPAFSLHQIEQKIDPGTFSLHGGSHSSMFGSGIPVERHIKTKNVNDLHIQERPKDRAMENIKSCLEEGFTSEIAAFSLSRSILAEEVSPDLLSQIQLDCLSGDPEKISVAKSDAQEVVSNLFSAASFGGAYSQGMGGAYGRLAVWRALAGLVDVDPNGVTATELEQIVNDSSWFIFHADNDWFCKVAWDLGIICLRRGNQSLALLAATSTD